MCLRLILCTVLLVSVTIILSSSSSEHRLRRRSHSWKACEPFKLPSNAEWIRRWYGRRCKGLFVCCEGYELVVKTVCNKRGRWRVKTFCVPIRTTITPTTSSTTASSTTASTTEPTTEPTTSPTTSDSGIQCDADPVVENGVITSDEISTDVGSVVLFNCSSGFTGQGRVGTLTCNTEGLFDPNLDCEDCRMDDENIISGTFNDNSVQTENEQACNDVCSQEPDCVASERMDSGLCIIDFTLEEIISPTITEEGCRGLCFNNNSCVAFTVTATDAQSFPRTCSLFTRPFDNVISATNPQLTFSTCL